MPLTAKEKREAQAVLMLQDQLAVLTLGQPVGVVRCSLLLAFLTLMLQRAPDDGEFTAFANHVCKGLPGKPGFHVETVH
jgi:hypothetical protein